MGFLHGVEFVQVQKGAVPVTEVKSAIIGLVGIAPIGSLNEMVLVSNAREAETKFGKQVPNFTIPQALAAIFAQGPARVIVINVFDPDDTNHVNTATAEAHTLVAGKTALTNAPVGEIVLTNSAGDETFEYGVDYSVDAYGNIEVLDFDVIGATDTVKATYDFLDLSGIPDADVVGSSDPRTGFQLFDEAFPLFGYQPKILLCPGFCEADAVAAAMISKADSLEATCLIDAPQGTAFADVIAARGPGGTLAGFTSASKRALLLYPHLSAYDPATDAAELRPYSPFFAGLMANNDRANGYWSSPSNKELKGILGVEFNLTSGLSDENSEVNQLNEAGIITVFNSFGTGFKSWGNRSASFPSNTSPDNFIAVNRVRDILHESVKLAMLQFIDRPIVPALIDSIRQTVNGFIRSLIQKGALVDGECLFIAEDNPPVQVAAGQLVFQVNFMPPTPAERLTFNSFIDINLLTALV